MYLANLAYLLAVELIISTSHVFECLLLVIFLF